MAQTGHLTQAPQAAASWLDPVTRLRIIILVTILVVWESVAASGLLLREVVPSLVRDNVVTWSPFVFARSGTPHYDMHTDGELIRTCELAERYDLPGTYAAICFVILVSVLFFIGTERIERWLRPGT